MVRRPGSQLYKGATLVNKKWTRRKFRDSSLKGSAMIAGGLAIAGRERLSGTTVQSAPSPTGLDSHQQKALRAAMDELIPAGDGMPAASEVGGVEYLSQLARRSPEIRQVLVKSLARLEGEAQRQFANGFAALAHADRVAALQQLERRHPGAFARLRDYVYESYYTQPRVWKLIGYEFYATNQSGPRMKPFDESVLAKVKKMPKLYREIT
jgi:hypothetical protein